MLKPTQEDRDAAEAAMKGITGYIADVGDAPDSLFEAFASHRIAAVEAETLRHVGRSMPTRSPTAHTGAKTMQPELKIHCPNCNCEITVRVHSLSAGGGPMGSYTNLAPPIFTYGAGGGGGSGSSPSQIAELKDQDNG